MKLLLVHHGQTDWSLNRRFQGQRDIQLSTIGIQQATALANGLSREHIDVILAT